MRLSRENAQLAENQWLLTAHFYQLTFGKWPRTLVMMGGRGAGKTRTGAEWVHALVHGRPPYARTGEEIRQIALVGETLGDVREVMIEGEAGVIAVHERHGDLPPRYETARRRLVWPTGAVAHCFSSEDPESLRGPQFDAAWCDEIGKWKNAEATWDMLQFGLRKGDLPRQIVTTTPRPTALVKRVLADADSAVHRFRTRDNSANLAKSYLRYVESRYGSIRLGRQELDGELIEDRDDGLWERARLEACHVEATPALRRIVVAVDPPASAGRKSNACGIVAAGLDGDGNVIVLADATRKASKPDDWARTAVALYHRLQADCILAEVNQGGDMVGAVIRTVDGAVPVKAVRANRGKWLRAEPVAALYAQGLVKHAGRFELLEDEMCDFGRDGLSGGRSPDRVDALVWAVHELALRDRPEPRIRGL